MVSECCVFFLTKTFKLLVLGVSDAAIRWVTAIEDEEWKSKEKEGLAF